MKNKAVIASFLIVLFGFAVVNLFIPAKDVSVSERRKLQQFPSFTLERILNTQFMDDFENYAVDQFLLREQFRALKAATDRLFFSKTDTNGLFVRNGHIFKIEYPLKEDKVRQMAAKMTAVQKNLLEGKKVHYSIVPDKNYFLGKNSGMLVLDYDKLIQIMNENLKTMKYIDIFNSLTLDDYYTTDSHWRQEKLENVVNTLWNGLSVSARINIDWYTTKSYNPFYGVYYGQSARAFKPDRLVWLENQTIRGAKVTGITADAPKAIYDLDKLGGMDSYEMFLSGAQPVIILENPYNLSGKSLIVFRDSFGSSIAPLLLESYSTVTLIDLRYAKSFILKDYVDFDITKTFCFCSAQQLLTTAML